VLQYKHVKGGGEAISSGFVYRGTRIPSLKGKFIFGDISTGNVWWVDYARMLAADVTKPETVPEMEPIRIRRSVPAGSSEVYGSMYPITELAYHARGGALPTLPGFAKVPAGGRSDIHLWADSKGEIYIMSKSDGMIRKVVGATVGTSVH
jgi:hypothetical protein